MTSTPPDTLSVEELEIYERAFDGERLSVSFYNTDKGRGAFNRLIAAARKGIEARGIVQLARDTLYADDPSAGWKEVIEALDAWLSPPEAQEGAWAEKVACTCKGLPGEPFRDLDPNCPTHATRLETAPQEARKEGAGVHMLRIWPSFFEAVKCGSKTYELRRDDREFRVGDTLQLAEWQPDNERYTGQSIFRRIATITRNVPEWGLKEGFCILGLEPLPSPTDSGEDVEGLVRRALIEAQELHLAPSGHGPHAGDWSDKPHRVVYDATALVRMLAAALRKLSKERDALETQADAEARLRCEIKDEKDRLERDLYDLRVAFDPPVCRLQFPDGSVPGNAAEGAEGWHKWAQDFERRWKDATADRDRLQKEVERAKAIVDEQAKDEGLWFIAATCTERYLQQALRRLHEAVEGKSQADCARAALTGASR